jgi:hypothetical protein
LRKILALALCLALMVCAGVTAFAEPGVGEPEDTLAEDAPQLEEPADLSDEPQDTLPDTLPALAPGAAQGTNPDTGEAPLLAGAIAAGAAAVAALVLAAGKRRKNL